MGEFDFSRWQLGVRRTVAEAGRERQKGALLDCLEKLASQAEELLNFHAAGNRSLIDCGPGCGSCCVVNVSALVPEGVAVARYLRRLPKERREKIVARLEKLWCEVRGLDDDDRLYMRRSCAFLDDQGCCVVYPVRPLLCRSITSTDAQSCRDALSGKVFGEETAVLMHQFQQQLYEVLFKGVADGMEQLGVDGRSFQLSGLVRYLLRRPDTEEELLAGKRLAWRELY